MTALIAQDFTFSWFQALMILFVIISILMILVVLIQRPQGGGLSGAFGGASSDGAGQTAFGAKTGDALTLATVTIFIIFLVCAVGLNFALRPDDAQARPEAGPASGGAQTTPGEDESTGVTATDSQGNTQNMRRLTPEEIEALMQGNQPAPTPATGDAPPAEDPPAEDPAPEGGNDTNDGNDATGG